MMMTDMEMMLLPLSLFLLPMAAPVFFPVDPNEIVKREDYDLYYVGENLTLYCHKNSDFVGNVLFKRNSVDISSEYVRKLNSTWARMTRRVTRQDFPYTMYQCTDNDVSPWVALLWLYHEYRPRQATDLSVDWQADGGLRVEWGFGGITYKNSHPSVITITAEWSRDVSRNKVWHECTVTHNSCVLSDIDQSPFTLSVRVNVTVVRRHNDRVSTPLPAVTVQAPSVGMARSSSTKLMASEAVVGILALMTFSDAV